MATPVMLCKDQDKETPADYLSSHPVKVHNKDNIAEAHISPVIHNAMPNAMPNAMLNAISLENLNLTQKRTLF